MRMKSYISANQRKFNPPAEEAVLNNETEWKENIANE